MQTNSLILSTIKHMLGGDMVADVFDSDILIHISTVLGTLNQLGVKVISPIITEKSAWDEVIPDIGKLPEIKTYIYLKVRKIFDPPTMSSVANSMDELISEYEWRIQATVETPTVNF